MTETVAKLVAIYARNKADEVKADAEYQALCTEHENNARFHEQRHIIENLKRRLEKNVNSQLTTQDEAVECLRYLNRIIKSDDKFRIEAYRALIDEGYKPGWTKNQANHFDEYSDRLENCADYFLSFTTRNSNVPNDNVVNSRYRSFIQYVLGDKTYESADRSAKNLLAEAIHSVMKTCGLQGFYYPDREGDNTFVDKKLTDECSHCVAFVQVVQNVMFEHAKVNYCHLEYKVAKAHAPSQNCLKFVLAEKNQESLIREQEVPIDYEEWYSEVKGRDKLILGFSEQYDLDEILAIKEKVEDKLAEKIKRLKWQLVEAVPEN